MSETALRLRAGVRSVAWGLSLGLAATLLHAFLAPAVLGPFGGHVHGVAAALAAIEIARAAAVLAIALAGGFLAAPGKAAGALGGVTAVVLPALVVGAGRGSAGPGWIAMRCAAAVACAAAGVAGERLGRTGRR